MVGFRIGLFDILNESSLLPRSETPSIPTSAGIYALYNKDTGMFYIGRSVNLRKRLYSHYTSDYSKSCGRKLANAKKKYSVDAFYFSVIETCDPSLIEEREQFYLDWLDPFDDRGYNTQRESGSLVSFVMPETQRKKLSISLKEYHRNNVNAFKGKTHSAESREKIRKGVRDEHGNLKSDKSRTKEWIEERRKQSTELGVGVRLQEWIKENGHPRSTRIVMIDINSGEELMCFPSAHTAAQYFGKSRSTAITNNLSGRSKSAYGFKWRKIAK